MRKRIGPGFRALALLGALTWMQAPGAAESDNWPQFRGPDGTSVVADDPRLPETWSATENVAWKTPVPGLGWSSPIVWDDRVFLTTVVAEEDYEGPQPGLYLPESGLTTVDGMQPGTHRWTVICLDLDSGRRAVAADGARGGRSSPASTLRTPSPRRRP